MRATPLRLHERPQERLASERRRAYFEWTEERIAEVVAGGDPKRSLDLAQGRNLPRFRDIPLMDEEALSELRAHLCEGVARLGDLPPLAIERKDIVPLVIAPRTPHRDCVLD